jgi:hypothetical protein
VQEQSSLISAGLCCSKEARAHSQVLPLHQCGDPRLLDWRFRVWLLSDKTELPVISFGKVGFGTETPPASVFSSGIDNFCDDD